jgi:hypothetical protein
VIYGFPGEPAEEYDRMADVMKGLTHLTPPGNLDPVQVHRFSPYYDRPWEYGLKITGPRFYYPLIYPADQATLSDLAYSFEYSYDDGRDPKTYLATISESIETWRKDYDDGSNLSYPRRRTLRRMPNCIEGRFSIDQGISINITLGSCIIHPLIRSSISRYED